MKMYNDMKKYKYFITVMLALSLFSCNKSTEGLSYETVPCKLELLGETTVLVQTGGQYIEAGYIAVEDTIDVTAAVTVSGTLNTSVIGRYTLRYEVKNSDGVSTIAKRTVIVFDPASPTGFYKVSAESYRNSPPSNEYSTEPEILIYQEESGAYFVSDLFGGYYSVGRGYGANYETGGSINIRNGAVSLVSSRTTPWGDVFSSVSGTYDSDTQTFDIVVVWDAGYTFYLKLIKQ